MFFIPLIVAAGSFPSLISGAPILSFVSRDTPSLIPRESAGSYTVFGGNGDVSDGWPSLSDWADFESMFENNMEIMKSSCYNAWQLTDNSDEEIADLKASILQVSQESGVPANFIFAIVMQESNGCVRVPTTNYGVNNPGLMQSHDGAGSCNENGVIQTPCPQDQILQMVRDGATGTASGAGLQGCLEQAPASGVTKYYQAARIYNSGSLASTLNLGQGGATACYVSDVTNRLLGWSQGTSQCSPTLIGTLTSAIGSFIPAPAGQSSPDPEPTTTTVATTATTAATTVTTAATTATTSATTATTAATTTATTATTTATTPVTTATTAATTTTTTATTATTAATTTTTATTPPTETASSPDTPNPTAATPDPSAPVYPYAKSPCLKYYTVQLGDYCDEVATVLGITFPELQQWNSGLDTQCSNLWLGYQYCVSA